jgi:hypothetical protein
LSCPADASWCLQVREAKASLPTLRSGSAERGTQRGWVLGLKETPPQIAPSARKAPPGTGEAVVARSATPCVSRALRRAARARWAQRAAWLLISYDAPADTSFAR